MMRLKASLLGAFDLATDDGRSIRIETRKARALFAVLLMARGKPIRRERLASLLWSRTTTRQSLASLSQALYSLRRALEDVAPDLIDARTDSVAIRADRIDVDALKIDASSTEGEDGERIRCLGLYVGPFLDDLAIDTEEEYAAWRRAERARLEDLVVQAGTRLMESWEHAPGDADIALVDDLLSIDPYNEPAMRVRITALALLGRRAAALEAADTFAATLSADLGIVPSDALADLAGRVRNGSLSAAQSVPVGPAGLRPYRWVFIAAAAVACVALWWSTFAPRPEPDREVARLLVRPFEAGEGVATDLAHGFSDDLSTALVRRSGMDVLSRESGRLVAKGREADSGASHVLRGRMRGEGDRWVLNVWITRTADGHEVWADRFSGSADAPRDVRDGILARITDGIGVEIASLQEPERSALPEEAMPAFLGALSRLHSGSPVGNAEALDRFAQLAKDHPETVEVIAGLVVALERVAFEADDYAQAARLHWLEGYLMLKRALAANSAEHPDMLAAQARLALRRLDHPTAQSLARRALAFDDGHVGALAVLSQSLALAGEEEAAQRFATRAVALSPAAPQDGYLSLALAAFAEEELANASEAIETAIQTARGIPLQLLVLRAAILGLQGEEAARPTFEDVVQALESRPYGAWRVGDVAFSNPRAATWRRPTATEAASLVRYASAENDARLLKGILAASGTIPETGDAARARPLSSSAIRDRLFNQRIAGQRTWAALGDWSQVRTHAGALFQDSAFGPLPGAGEGASVVVDDRLCDRWLWRGTEIENCQLVMHDSRSGDLALVGETGWFPFVTADAPEHGE